VVGREGDTAADSVVACERVGVDARVELGEFFSGHASTFSVLGFSAGAEKKVGERVEPCLVALAGGGCELDFSAWGDDDYGFTMEPGWHGVVVGDDTDGFDADRVVLELGAAGCSGVLVAPVKGAGVGVDPEVTSMTVVGLPCATGFARILPEILANHGLGDGLDHTWVSITVHTVHGHAIRADVEPLV
jgi:hypothetical protein